MSGPTALSDTADLVLILGPLLSDTNTAAWSAIPKTENVVKFNLDDVEMDGQIYQVRSKTVLHKLIVNLRQQPHQSSTQPRAASVERSTKDHSVVGTQHISQDAFWARMSHFLHPDDTVLYANGTPLIGSRDMPLPAGGSTQVVASGIWCSIGQMLPAAQGISLAKRDNGIPGRTIL